MFSSRLCTSSLRAVRLFSTTAQVEAILLRSFNGIHDFVFILFLHLQNSSKVAVLGAAGGIGQPMSLLLKCSPLISKLALYDIVATPGVAADLSHIETPAQVTGHMGPEELDAALKDCNVVVIPAGVPRKPGELCLG